MADVLWSCAGGLARLDFHGIRRLAPKLGALLWATMPSRRALAVHNISRSLGLSLPAARDIARESFNQNALSFLETVLTPRFGFEHPDFRLDNPELFARLQTTPAPVVISAAHLGAWELQAGLLGQFSTKERPCVMVVRRYGNKIVNELIMRLRSSRGAEVLGHRAAVYPVLRNLRRNGLAAFLVDHNAGRSEALFLPFLGRDAAVNFGPALLAVRTKAEIWPSCLLRQGENYVFCQEPPLNTAELTGDRDTNVLAAARFYTEAAERFVRRAPEQWFWMHNRWKTQKQPQ